MHRPRVPRPGRGPRRGRSPDSDAHVRTGGHVHTGPHPHADLHAHVDAYPDPNADTHAVAHADRDAHHDGPAHADALPTVSGAYDNLAEHADGRYALQLAGTRVAATIATSRSPVQHWAKEVTEPLFTVPEPFRPPYPIRRTVTGTPVLADGTPDPDHPEPRRFLLRVDPDGAVHYVDDGPVEGVGPLAYALHTVWGTTPAANDLAILAIFYVFANGLDLSVPPLQPFNGVTLNAERRVIALYGGWLNLPGTIPAELGQLTELQSLTLVYSGLRGGIPESLGQLEQLTYLDLSHNVLTGAIPESLGQLEQLTYLDLSRNLLTGAIPETLGQLGQLEVMHLSGQPKGGHGYGLQGKIPLALGRLSRLTDLNLSYNRLTGAIPPELGQLSRLTRLNLERNQLSGPIPPELGQLSRLTSLDLECNQLSGPIPPELGQLAALGSFLISGNSLTGCLPAVWSTKGLVYEINRMPDNDPYIPLLPYCSH